MKKIAFVATSYIVKYDGISVYTENLLLELLKEIEKENRKYELDIYTGKSAIDLLSERISKVELLNNKINLISINDKNFLTKITDLNIKLIKKSKYDLIFMPNFMPTMFLSNTLKVIHDFSVNNFPELYSNNYLKYHNALLWYGKKFDKGIGYISNTTKFDLNKFHNINEKNTQLIHLPNGIPFKVRNFERPNDNDVLLKYKNTNLELLVVGRINKHKGFDRILEFCQYFDNNKENEFFDSITLNIVGKQTEETTKLFKDLNLKKINLVFHGFLNDEELNTLYIKSDFCLFLSRNEGYGLPLLEAMWFKSIPIISNISIFNEIMGEDYPKFDDKTAYKESISSFILKIYKDEEYRNKQKKILEEIVKKESNGYNISAKNLINYIKGL